MMTMIAIVLLALSATPPTPVEGFGPIATLTNKAKSTSGRNYIDDRSSPNSWHVLEPVEPLPLELVDAPAPVEGFGPIVTLTNNANKAKSAPNSWHVLEPVEPLSLELVDENYEGEAVEVGLNGKVGGAVNGGNGISGVHQRPFFGSRDATPSKLSAPKKSRAVRSGRDRRASRDTLTMFESLNSRNKKVTRSTTELINEKKYNEHQEELRSRSVEVISGRERRQRRAERTDFSPIGYGGSELPLLSSAQPMSKGEKTSSEVLEELDSISFGGKSNQRDTLPVEAPMDMPFPESLPPHLSIVTIPGNGVGVFTEKSISRGDIVGEYKNENGPIIDDEYHSSRGSLPWIRFVNHASPPYDNVISQEHTGYNGEGFLWLIAKDDIHAGEEICFDYGDDYFM